MTNREFNALVQRYTEEIKNEFSAGFLNYNKDGKIKKSKLLPRDITNGAQRRIQAEGKTVEECAEKLALQYRKKVEHIDNIIKSRTFEEIANEWYEVEIKNSSISDGNKKNYAADLKNHIIPKLGKFDMAQLKKRDYQIFLNGFAGKGVSMVKKIRMTLIRIINYAIENEYIPDRTIRLTLSETTPINKRNVLKEQHIKLLVKAQKNYLPAYVFIVMVATGMRPCELFDLTYDDIDFENKTIFIKKSKTDNGIRTIPITDYPLKLIKEDMERLNAMGIKPKYIFHQQIDHSKPHNIGTVYDTWQTTIRHMDIINGAVVYRNEIIKSSFSDKENFSVYNLRHTYCTMLNDCGIGEYFKKKLMGHTLKDSITDSVYTHSSTDMTGIL